MEQLFKTLRAILDKHEKATADLTGADIVFATNDLGEALGDAIAAFSEAAQQAADDGAEGPVVVPEPEFTPDFLRLATGAVRALAIRGDIVGQLRGAGADDEADAVEAFLANAEGESTDGTRTVTVSDER